MLIITTIYFAPPEAVREPATKIIERKLSGVADTKRNLVVVYAGTNRQIPSSNS